MREGPGQASSWARSGCRRAKPPPLPPSVLGSARHLAWWGAVRWAPGRGLGDQEAHFFLKVPRILGTNLPTLLSLVSSSAGASPAPAAPASSFLQKTSNRL